MLKVSLKMFQNLVLVLNRFVELNHNEIKALKPCIELLKLKKSPRLLMKGKELITLHLSEVGI